MKTKKVEMSFYNQEGEMDIYECPRCRTHKKVKTDAETPLCECDPEMLKANLKPNIRVYWDCKTTTEGDFYEDDNGREYQSSPVTSRKIEIEERHTSEIKDIFEEQDGDWDFTQSIFMITDTKGKVLYDPKCKIAHITDNYDLWHKWNNEKDPFRKASYSDELINGTQERQRLYGLDRDRKQERFIEWCQYKSQEEVNERRDKEGDEE